MKARLKIIRIFIIISIILFTNIRWTVKNIHASSLTLSASAYTVEVGEYVTFTVTGYGLAGRIDFVGAVSGSEWIEDNSFSYTVYASEEGILQVSVSGLLAELSTASEGYYEKSVSVNVVSNIHENDNIVDEIPHQDNITSDATTKEDKHSKSSINTLDNIILTNATLKTPFMPTQLTYEAKLKEDAKQITIDAVATDVNSVVDGLGVKKIHPGQNEFVIKVTSEDGKTLQYKILLTAKAEKKIKFKYKDTELVSTSDRGKLNNQNYTKVNINIDHLKIPAWKNKISGMVLLYLNDGEKNNYYIYDEKLKLITSIYLPIYIDNMNLAIIDIPKHLQKRNDMILKTIEIDGKKIKGWEYKNKEFKNYYLIYALNEKGEEVYYKYEKTENSLQLYDKGIALTTEQYNSEIELYKLQIKNLEIVMLTFGAIICLFILILIIITLVYKKNKRYTL